MGKNTTPELYDDSTEIVGGQGPSMTQEEILMSESDLLAGILELVETKDKAENYHKIQIRRGGVLKLEFRIRPITEDETQVCLRRSNKYAVTKPGQPRKVLDTNNAKFRSLVLYTATVDEDRAKVWDNKTAMETCGVFEGWEMVDKVLLIGEKNRALDKVDEISGFDDGMEEFAGN